MVRVKIKRKKDSKKKERFCRWCGMEFEPRLKGAHFFCSDNCRYTHKNEMRARRAAAAGITQKQYMEKQKARNAKKKGAVGKPRDELKD